MERVRERINVDPDSAVGGVGGDGKGEEGMVASQAVEYKREEDEVERSKVRRRLQSDTEAARREEEREMLEQLVRERPKAVDAAVPGEFGGSGRVTRRRG